MMQKVQSLQLRIAFNGAFYRTVHCISYNETRTRCTREEAESIWSACVQDFMRDPKYSKFMVRRQQHEEQYAEHFLEHNWVDGAKVMQKILLKLSHAKLDFHVTQGKDVKWRHKI